MGIIVPAIIPTSREELETKLAPLVGLCQEIQIDTVDGRFAFPASWPYEGHESDLSRMLAEGELLPHTEDFRFEVDLMTTDPESIAGTWIGVGAVRLTVHAESTRFVPRFIANTRALYGRDKEFAPDLLSVGVAIGANTDFSLIEPYLKDIDYVQFMGIGRIGVQGQPFLERTIERITWFRKAHPGIPVQVDGGVSLSNAARLLTAGVSRLVVGSAIWKSEDPAQAYRDLAALTERHGVYED